jgi:hypothetical protein
MQQSVEAHNKGTRTKKKKKNKKCSGKLQLVQVEHQSGSFNMESAGLFTHLLKFLVENLG